MKKLIAVNIFMYVLTGLSFMLFLSSGNPISLIIELMSLALSIKASFNIKDIRQLDYKIKQLDDIRRKKGWLN